MDTIFSKEKKIRYLCLNTVFFEIKSKLNVKAVFAYSLDFFHGQKKCFFHSHFLQFFTLTCIFHGHFLRVFHGLIIFCFIGGNRISSTLPLKISNFRKFSWASFVFYWHFLEFFHWKSLTTYEL